MRTRSRANFPREKAEVDLSREPVAGGAGDAHGHAGKTSEVFRRGRAANGSDAPIIDPIGP
jgi:hypothetical protein